MLIDNNFRKFSRYTMNTFKFDNGEGTEHWSTKIKIENKLIRQFLAEMLGTSMIVIFGDGAAAQSTLTNGAGGGFLSVNFGFGFGLMIAVLVSGGVSGGHCNPAISFAQFLLGKIRFANMLVYMIAQYLGAFIGAAVVFGVYSEALMAFEASTTDGIRSIASTGGIFTNYPAPWLSAAGGFGDQLLGTFLLAFAVAAITDKKNMKIPAHLIPLFIGFTLVAIGIAFGVNTGFAVNPARDLGPRLFMTIAGWGWEAVSFQHYTWFWIPIVAAHMGAIIGSFTYVIAISNHWPED